MIPSLAIWSWKAKVFWWDLDNPLRRSPSPSPRHLAAGESEDMSLFRKGVFVDVIGRDWRVLSQDGKFRQRHTRAEEKATWATRQGMLVLPEGTESRTPSLEVPGEQGPSTPLNLEFQKMWETHSCL